MRAAPALFSWIVREKAAVVSSILDMKEDVAAVDVDVAIVVVGGGGTMVMMNEMSCLTVSE
jgi:hypothetical protein